MNNQNPTSATKKPVSNKPKKTLSLVSLILGIASMTICILVPGPVNIAGFITGFLARKKEPDGKKLSLIGMILSGVALIPGIILFVVVVIGIIFAANA